MNITAILFLVGYFGLVLGIGVWAMRIGAGKDLEGFLLGGRRVGPLVTALTLQSTSMSGYMFLGAGALGFAEGYWALWYAAGDIGGGVLNLSIIGRRMRKFSQILGALTSIEYLELRYPSPLIRSIAGGLTVFLLGCYVLAQFIAGGKGMELVTGVPYWLALAIAVSIILVYTLIGGYLAVAYTDALQSVVMLIGIGWILVAALIEVGGLTAANESIGLLDPTLLSVWGRGLGYEGQWGMVLGAVLIFSVGYMGWPHVVTRHLAMQQPSTARQAGAYATAWNLLFVSAPYILGILAIIILPDLDDPELAMQQPSTARQAGAYATAWNLLFVSTPYILGILAIIILPDLDDPELAIMRLAENLLPAAVTGVVMAAIMAAIMSTADSLLLQTGSVASRDLYGRFVNPDASQAQMVWVSRALVLGIGVVGYFIALIEPPTVFGIVVFATSVLGSAFLPAYVCAVWWRRANTPGAIASMITGATIAFTWEPVGLDIVSGLHPMLAGVIGSTLVMIAVSLATERIAPVPRHVLAAMDEAARVGPIPEALLAAFK